MPLQCQRCGSNLRLQLLLLPSLLQLRVALCGQNFVGSLIVTTAQVADELAQQLAIFHRLRRCLADFGRAAGGH